jgi:RimJ/RimL family protein N-acetyltransferase
VTVRLTVFAAEHVPAFERMADDETVAAHTPFPHPLPPGFGTQWLARYDAARAEGTREAFAVLDGDELVGIAVAPRIDTTAREVELGYVVARSARGRGIATAALGSLTRWAFDEWRAARVYLRINTGNEASRRVAVRCGYTYEGTLRSTWFKDDLRVDTEIWSRLPDDG